MPARVLDILIENFEIERDVVVRSSTRLGFADWMALTSVERPKLKDTPFVSRALWHRQDADGIFEHIKYRDTLLHHPFDSFATFEAFLDAAVDDEHVVAIKMTLYRVGNKSPLVERLMAAAEAGKQVAVLVELKARFDERSNIGWASRLEEAGVHVVYGLVNLKTHCKLCLVIRKEGDAIQRYVHIGTGNYNRATAQVYTDFGLFTANPRIAADASELFNYLTGYSKQTSYRELIVAPVALRERLTALIEREVGARRAGRPAGIIIKNNAISDPGIIQVLYAASRAGVPVRAIARGICCLRPGIPGVSETIEVRSIVGRFLEHSRVYYFENGGKPVVYLGSADLMERNLDRRVETLCPVLDPDIARFIRHTILEAYLTDTERASVLRADGTYEVPKPARLQWTRSRCWPRARNMSRLVLVIALTALAAAQSPDGYKPGRRVLLDAHNAYPYQGRWNDRLDRALATGIPIAIEQDLFWMGSAWPFHRVARRTVYRRGANPARFLRAHPSHRDAGVAASSREQWPLITLNLDFKDAQPQHFAAIWNVLGEYQAWLTTARRVAAAEQVEPLELGPVLVLTGSDPRQQAAFHDACRLAPVCDSSER